MNYQVSSLLLHRRLRRRSRILIILPLATCLERAPQAAECAAAAAAAAVDGERKRTRRLMMSIHASSFSSLLPLREIPSSNYWRQFPITGVESGIWGATEAEGKGGSPYGIQVTTEAVKKAIEVIEGDTRFIHVRMGVHFGPCMQTFRRLESGQCFCVHKLFNCHVRQSDSRKKIIFSFDKHFSPLCRHRQIHWVSKLPSASQAHLKRGGEGWLKASESAKSIEMYGAKEEEE